MQLDGTRRRHRGALVGLLTAVAVVGAAIAGPAPAWACSCVAPPAPETALREADAVFTGEVTRVTERRGVEGRTVVARLAVDEVFTGEVGASVDVHTPRDSAACGYAFTVGRAELVYAVQDGEGRLQTNLCDRTAPVPEADADLTAFGAGQPPADAASGAVDARLVATAGALLVAAGVLVGAALRRRRPDAGV